MKFLDNGFPLAIFNTRNKEVWNKLWAHDADLRVNAVIFFQLSHKGSKVDCEWQMIDL